MRRRKFFRIYANATLTLLIAMPSVRRTSGLPQIDLLVTTSILTMMSPMKPAMRFEITFSTTMMCWRRRIGGSVNSFRSKTRHEGAKSTMIPCEQPHYT